MGTMAHFADYGLQLKTCGDANYAQHCNETCGDEIMRLPCNEWKWRAVIQCLSSRQLLGHMEAVSHTGIEKAQSRLIRHNRDDHTLSQNLNLEVCSLGRCEEETMPTALDLLAILSQ